MRMRDFVHTCIIGKMARFDVEKYIEELKKQTEIRDNLVATTKRMQKAVYEAQIILKDVPNEENVWKDCFTEQQTYNRQLQSELEQLEQKHQDLRVQLEAVGVSSEPVFDEISDTGMRQLLKQLQKEKKKMEWQLKECEWRLDQEAAGQHKAMEQKKAMLTQLEHIDQQAHGESNDRVTC